MISIIDCKMGNIGSIVNIIRHIGYDAEVVTTKDQVLQAKKLIFPGIGNWHNGVAKLEKSGLKPAIIESVKGNKTPLMGICLGMQLLFSKSEEAEGEGLDFIPGKVKRFSFNEDERNTPDLNNKLRIPHMGWNEVIPCKGDEPILLGLYDDMSFYFAHSFHAIEVPEKNILLTCNYGYEFVCGVNLENVWGFQFHPEKSHKFGMQLFKNFVEKV